MGSKQKLGIGFLVLSGLVAIGAWRIEAASTRILATRYPIPVSALAVSSAQSDAKDGERLARLNGCMSCHGPQLAGRVRISGYFGTRLIAPNLTRIVRHRLDAQLAAAIRFGIKPDGTSLIDMPAGKFVKSSDSDIAAIIAYLRTLPERPNATAKSQWRFGGRAMLAMGLLPLEAAMVDPEARGPAQTPTLPLALGRYITQSQCSACHGADLSGEPEESSPDLRFSIQHYSPAAFQRFLSTGMGQKGHGTRVMTRTIHSQLKYLTVADVRAVYAYLNLPQAEAEKMEAPTPPSPARSPHS